MLFDSITAITKVIVVESTMLILAHHRIVFEAVISVGKMRN